SLRCFFDDGSVFSYPPRVIAVEILLRENAVLIQTKALAFNELRRENCKRNETDTDKNQDDDQDCHFVLIHTAAVKENCFGHNRRYLTRHRTRQDSKIAVTGGEKAQATPVVGMRWNKIQIHSRNAIEQAAPDQEPPKPV